MGKQWPQREIKEKNYQKNPKQQLEKIGNKITCKGENIVKVADQLPVKIIWRLKDKCTKINYFNDKRVMDKHTLNKRLYMISKT